MTELPSKDERIWAMLCHISSFAFFIFPFGNIVVPLIIWLIKKDEYSLVDDQGKESLNFQVSVTIYALICLLLIVVAIGLVFLGILFVVAFVLVIVAGIKANDGVAYRYPLTIRLIK